MSMKIIDVAFHGVSQWQHDQLEQAKRSDTSLVVWSEDSALDVAEKMMSENAQTIFVLDESKDITGIVAPAWVTEQINSHFGINAQNLREALEHLNKQPEEELRHYRHEWLNFERPVLFWCERGKHFTSDENCSIHS